MRDVTAYRDVLRVLTRSSETDRHTFLDARGLRVQALDRLGPTIEEVFISIIGDTAPAEER